MTTIAPDDLILTRGHYAALRAHLQGLSPATIAGLYLGAAVGNGSDEGEGFDTRRVLREIQEVRDALVQRAHQHGRPELVLALQRDVRGSNAGMDRAVDAVHRLEALGTPRPALHHTVEQWFAPALARRLRAAGLSTVGEVIACANARGRGWWRRIPRVGALAAHAVVAWLHSHETTLGAALGAHVTGDPLTLNNSRPLVTIDAGAAVAPLEALRIVEQLDGSNGRNRGARERCTLSAVNDYEAILTWLSLRVAGSHTWRAYRKEAERFLLWAIVERGVPLSSLRVEECVAYRDFLAHPQPAERWCGPMVARLSPAWRPFQGPLSPASQKHALVILRGMCEWLMRQHYLDSNPWDGVPDRAPVDSRMQIDKALSADLWERLWQWLGDESRGGGKANEAPAAQLQLRIARAAIALMRDSGPRLSEVCSALREKLRRAEDADGELWELTLVGKRNKLRTIPVSARTIAALRAHWRDRGLDFDSQENGPLLAPVVIPRTATASAKAEGGKTGYSPSGLHHLIERTSQRFTEFLNGEEPLARHRPRVRAHALRHTFGVHSAAAQVDLDVIQQILGHTSLSTTTIYVQGDRKRRLKEIGKLYGEGKMIL